MADLTGILEAALKRKIIPMTPFRRDPLCRPRRAGLRDGFRVGMRVPREQGEAGSPGAGRRHAQRLFQGQIGGGTLISARSQASAVRPAQTGTQPGGTPRGASPALPSARGPRPH